MYQKVKNDQVIYIYIADGCGVTDTDMVKQWQHQSSPKQISNGHQECCPWRSLILNIMDFAIQPHDFVYPG